MTIPKSGSGILRSKGLFLETADDKATVKYTLKDQDYQGLPSLRRLYLEQDDPSEYFFAINVLGSVAQWDEILKAKWFQPFISTWRKELDLRMKAHALTRLREEAASGSRNSFQANRYLLEKGWETKESRRGRPTKAEIHAEAQLQAQVEKQLDDDFERLVTIQ